MEYSGAALDHEPVADSASVISPAPNLLEVYAPHMNLDLRYRMWDGQTWTLGAVGPTVRIPSRYRFSVDYVRANTTRSASTDTEATGSTLAVGNWASRIKPQWIGDIGGPLHPHESQTNLLEFETETVDLAEAVSFGYLVVNNESADPDKIMTALSNAGNGLNLVVYLPLRRTLKKAS